MKYSRSHVRGKAYAIPRLRCETQSLTSFAGIVLLQRFFALITLKAPLASCFRHLPGGKVFSRVTLFLQRMLHLVLGYRELRDSRCCRDDPLVQRFLGRKRLPDVATLSRMLKEADARSVQNLRGFLGEMRFERLEKLTLWRITRDFDGSVLSTTRPAEGTAVGFNKKKKGARSYYPLFCTSAQTGQVLDFLYRSGNVHDSHGAREFILACIQAVREALPQARIETRRAWWPLGVDRWGFHLWWKPKAWSRCREPVRPRRTSAAGERNLPAARRRAGALSPHAQAQQAEKPRRVRSAGIG